MEGSLQGLWKTLENKKYAFLRRAREASALTLPFVIPPQSSSGATDLATPFQSDGARAVNNLAAKLLLSQFPPNSPFFKLVLDSSTAQELAGVGEEASDEVRKSLIAIVDSVHHEIETSGFRPVAAETFRNLVISGNALFEWQPDQEPRMFSLESYCCIRDGSGNIELVLIQEKLSKTTLPPEIQGLVKVEEGSEEVLLYTLYHRKPDGSWMTKQEAGQAEISQGSLNAEDLPVLALRMNRKQGESYGRGIVEEYLGDLRSLEALSQSLVHGAAASARLLGLVDPNGSTDVQRLNDTPNGGFTPGNAEDVTWLRVEKASDFSFVLQASMQIRENLARAFLLNTSIQRQAERVTAEEIRFLAQELSDTFGGTYATLAREFQSPLVKLLLRRLQEEQKIPPLPEGLVEPKIVTGIEALGRGQELLRLRGFHADAVAMLGQDQVGMYLDPRGALTQLAVDYGLNTDGIVRDEEEIQALQQQAQMAALAQSPAASTLVNQAGETARNQL